MESAHVCAGGGYWLPRSVSAEAQPSNRKCATLPGRTRRDFSQQLRNPCHAHNSPATQQLPNVTNQVVTIASDVSASIAAAVATFFSPRAVPATQCPPDEDDHALPGAIVGTHGMPVMHEIDTHPPSPDEDDHDLPGVVVGVHGVHERDDEPNGLQERSQHLQGRGEQVGGGEGIAL